MRRRGVGSLIALGLVSLLCSCASLGTRSDVRNPELLGSIEIIGLAPVYVDELTLSVCAEAGTIATTALVAETEKSGAYRVVSADSLIAHAQADGGVTAEALVASAREQGLDGVLFCKVEAWEAHPTTVETVGFGVSFGTGGTSLGLAQEAVTTTEWAGAKVSFQMVDSRTGTIVCTTQFDTVKGKSYWIPPPPAEQIAHAMEGAFKPLAKAGAK